MKLTLCIDVDCIFDTRLGTIVRHCPKAYHDYFLSDVKRYVNRQSDLFAANTDLFTQEAFNQWYADRDVETLKHSIVTDVFSMVPKIKYHALKDKEITDDTAFEIIINTLHYTFTEEEKETFTLLLQKFLGFEHKITLVQIPTKDFSPEVIRKMNLDVIILYDFKTWSETFIPHENPKSLFHHPIGNVLMYVPDSLLVDDETVEETLTMVDMAHDLDRKFKPQFKDHRALLSSVLLGYVHLNYVSLKYLSITTNIIVKPEDEK